MSEPKFCKDCKHFKRWWLDSSLSACSLKRDPVTGKAGTFAGIERQYGDQGCGPDGKRFEPKPKSRILRFLGL